MDDISEPRRRSGGIDADQSDIHAQDLIGRDKIELNLPPVARRGCYAQLAENVKFAVFLGALMLLIYAFFQSALPRLNPETPTPTATLTATPEPTIMPTDEGQSDDLEQTAEPAPANVETVVVPGRGTSLPAEPSVDPVETLKWLRLSITPTPTPRRVATATSTLKPPPPPSPTLQPTATRVSPTPKPTPTRVPPTTTPRPRPSPTNTPRPTRTPVPTQACRPTSVRLGPVAKLATVGDTFTIKARVSCAAELAGYEVELGFDSSVVVVQSVNDGGFMASAGGSVFAANPKVENSAGKASVGAVVLRPGPYPSGSGTLALFTLRAIGEGSSDLSLSASLSDASAQPVSISVSGAGVLVQSAGTATPLSP